MEGNLAQCPVPELLRDLHARRDSGVLSLSNGTATKRVYFERGAIVFASSTVDDERIGERLVKEGKLKRADLDLACRVRAQSPLRLGATLVDMGYLTGAELDERLRAQVEHIVRSVLPWASGSFRKDLTAEPVDADLARADIPTLDLLLDGVRSIDRVEVIRRGLGSLDRPLRHAGDPRSLDPNLKLTAEEGFVLSRVDGAASAGEIARLSPMGEEETLRCIWALVAAGLLEIERDGSTAATPAQKAAAAPELSEEAARFREDMLAKHRRADSMTLYALLDVRPGARLEDIKAAYFRLAKKLHPDHRAGLKLDDDEGVLDELYLKVKSAYEVLSNETKRRRYDFQLERRSEAPRGEGGTTFKEEKETAPAPSPGSFSGEQMARVHYANGERYFNQGQYHEAVGELKAALRLDGSKAACHRLLARALAKNPKWRKQAEEHYRRALSINRFDGESYLELGELYASLGLATRARKMFEEAAALDPDNVRAQEKLEEARGGATTFEKLREILHRDRES